MSAAQDFGLAILIAEDDDGHSEPVAVVASIIEMKEIAASDLRGRMLRLESGESPFCPARYTLWVHDADGHSRLAHEIEA